MHCSTPAARARSHCSRRTAGVPQYHRHGNHRRQAAGGERLRLSCGRRELAVRLAPRSAPVSAAPVRVCLLRTPLGLVVVAVRSRFGGRFLFCRASLRSFSPVRPPRPRLHGTRELLAPHAQLIDPAVFQTRWTAMVRASLPGVPDGAVAARAHSPDYPLSSPKRVGIGVGFLQLMSRRSPLTAPRAKPQPGRAS